MPLGFQCIFRAKEDRVLAPDVAARRAFAKTLHSLGQARGMYGFGCGDTHGHTVHACDEPTARAFGKYATQALAHLLGYEMKPPTLSPIKDVWHAEELLRYVHEQDEHHGARVDPLREATSLPDLLGLRPSGLWLVTRVRETCPRVVRADLLRQWGVAEFGELVRMDLLAQSGAATIAAADLRGNTPDVVAARLACVHAAAGEPVAVIAAALAIDERSVRRHLARAPDAALLRAVRLQMGLRSMVSAGVAAYFLA